MSSLIYYYFESVYASVTQVGSVVPTIFYDPLIEVD
jgi:hypothetical protein